MTNGKKYIVHYDDLTTETFESEKRVQKELKTGAVTSVDEVDSNGKTREVYRKG